MHETIVTNQHPRDPYHIRGLGTVTLGSLHTGLESGPDYASGSVMDIV